MLLGGMIGLERGFKGRPAGFRTYLIVCLGTVLTMLLSQYNYVMMDTAWAELAASIGVRTDVSRFGAQVINGIGFIGAGTIIVTKRQRVKGLTTAAGLWTAAIVGLSFGAGFYEGGLFTTGLILLAELVFSQWEYRIFSNTPEVNLYMEYTGKSSLEEVLKFYRERNVKILNMEITRPTGSEKHNACVIFLLRLKCLTTEQLVVRINTIEGVLSMEEL